MRQCGYHRRVLLTRILFIASLAVLGGTLTACSTSDDAPPLASVSVTPSQTRLPIGSPLDLTYRFEPTAPLSGDNYTVFVHMLDSDGEMRWNDDHQPPVPTSDWQPGTPIEYTRTTFLPVTSLHPGDVTIEVGMYRDGERASLRGPREPRRTGSRAYPVADLQLTPESERLFIIYQSGWHPDEFADDPPQSWKWTEQSATINFRNPKADATLFIEYAANPDVFAGTPQVVTIVGADGQPIDSFAADSSDRVLRRIPVTAAQMGNAELAELRLDVDRTFVPAEHPGGGRDSRRLGIQVYHLFVQSR